MRSITNSLQVVCCNLPDDRNSVSETRQEDHRPHAHCQLWFQSSLLLHRYIQETHVEARGWSSKVDLVISSSTARLNHADGGSRGAKR